MFSWITFNNKKKEIFMLNLKEKQKNEKSKEFCWTHFVDNNKIMNEIKKKEK